MICYWNFNLVHRPDDANKCRPGTISGITNFFKLKKKTIINVLNKNIFICTNFFKLKKNVLNKNIFIFVLIDRQSKKL